MTPDRYRNAEFDVESLCRTARGLLAEFPAARDGRVQENPDPRIVRYYQSLGLVDRPSRYEGRQAVHGYRHLLQLVTVKRLQAEGYALADLQSGLAGASTVSLEEALAAGSRPGAPNRDREWPLEGGDSVLELAAPEIAGAAAPGSGLVAAEVAPGVTVIVDPARAGDPHPVISRITRLFSGESS